MSDSNLTQLREERKSLVKRLQKIVIEEAHIAEKMGKENPTFIAKVLEEVEVQHRIDEIDKILGK